MRVPIYSLPLKAARRLMFIINPADSILGRNFYMFPTKEYGNDLIFKSLNSDEPIMIARLGVVELKCILNYTGVKNRQENSSFLGFIKGKNPPWWWEPNCIKELQFNAGFFPGKIEEIEKFCELMIKDMNEVDILGSWLSMEKFFAKELSKSKRVMLEDLEPFFTPNPWTKALKGKKVVVVHPFAESIEMQYKKRSLIFENELLPEFELVVLKSVQTIAGEKTHFLDWFQALDFMKDQINKLDFDICILGCGAYGFPLAAHIKRIGKKAIHLGGVTQILFGIRGKRWEETTLYPFTNLFNQHWIRPGVSEKPRDAKKVEGACYW